MPHNPKTSPLCYHQPNQQLRQRARSKWPDWRACLRAHAGTPAQPCLTTTEPQGQQPHLPERGPRPIFQMTSPWPRSWLLEMTGTSSPRLSNPCPSHTHRLPLLRHKVDTDPDCFPSFGIRDSMLFRSLLSASPGSWLTSCSLWKQTHLPYVPTLHAQREIWPRSLLSGSV